MTDYQGEELAAEEVKVLNELEELVGEKIPKVGRVDLTVFGYKTEEGKVTGIGLHKKGLISLPAGLCQLTSLQHLNLQFNKIEELPEEIGALTKLEVLDLWKNKLTILPENIGQLKSLKDLCLSSNRLKALPDSLFNLKKLEKLDLWGNKLEILSAKIGGLQSLEKFILYDNLLEKIPEEVGDLENLVEINLVGNKLASIPKKACIKICAIREWKWSKIKEDDLKVIQELSIIIGVKIPKVKKMKKNTFGYKEKKGRIEALGMFNSWLNILPESIEDLSELKELDLSSCSLKILAKTIGKLEKLTKLDLTGNYLLEELPEKAIQQLKNQGCEIIT